MPVPTNVLEAELHELKARHAESKAYAAALFRAQQQHLDWAKGQFGHDGWCKERATSTIPPPSEPCRTARTRWIYDDAEQVWVWWGDTDEFNITRQWRNGILIAEEWEDRQDTVLAADFRRTCASDPEHETEPPLEPSATRPGSAYALFHQNFQEDEEGRTYTYL